MKDGLYEQLSALVDDELTGSEHELLFKRIESDEQVYQRLARYQLISDAMQSHLPDRVDPAFSLRVKRLLRAEPVLRIHPRLRTLARPMAGLAVAASVAVVAVMSLQTTQEDDVSAPNQSVAALPAPEGYLRVKDDTSGLVSLAADRKLDAYLVDHNEYAANRSMQGMLPYVRLVGHDMRPSVQE
jgi:sigma-E factor negative regulatory protein RseA